MSFSDKFNDFTRTVDKGIKKANEVAERTMDQIERYKTQYCRLSDKELIKTYKSARGLRMLACKELLKERGIMKSK